MICYWVSQDTATLDRGHGVLCPYSLNTNHIAVICETQQRRQLVKFSPVYRRLPRRMRYALLSQTKSKKCKTRFHAQVLLAIDKVSNR